MFQNFIAGFLLGRRCYCLAPMGQLWWTSIITSWRCLNQLCGIWNHRRGLWNQLCSIARQQSVDCVKASRILNLARDYIRHFARSSLQGPANTKIMKIMGLCFFCDPEEALKTRIGLGLSSLNSVIPSLWKTPCPDQSTHNCTLNIVK